MTNADPALLHGRLLGQPGEFVNLLQQVQRIEALDRTLRQWTKDPWLSAIRVANLRGETLVLFSDSAAALTTLRYQHESLTAFFRDRHGIVISRIEARVKPKPVRARV